MATSDERSAALTAFARLLANEPDDTKRSQLLAKAKLLAMQEAPEEAFEPPIRTLGQYLSDPIEVPPGLVTPYIVVRGGMTCTIGRAGKGKTVMNLNRLLRWSAGKPMFEGWHDSNGDPNLAPERPLRILVIENEGAGGLFHRQIGLMLHAQGYMSDKDRELAKENMLIWGEGGYSNLKLDDPAKLDVVRRGCEKWKPDIVFVEPFRGLWHGEENSATDMAKVIDALMEIGADYNAGIMLAHHERKGGVGEDGEKMSAGRGSTVLEGAVTVMENFESIKGGEQRELTWSKSRHAVAPNPVRMEWDAEAWWYKWVPASDLEEAIISALRNNADEPMNVRELCEELNEKPGKLRPVLGRLCDDSRIKKLPSVSTQDGSTGNRYRLPSDDGDFGGLSI
jgi:hypothetical protein